MKDIKKVFKFHIKSEKYPNGVFLQQLALTKEEAEKEIRNDFDSINDNIISIKFVDLV